MDDLTLILYKNAIVPGSEEAKVLENIKKGCFEIDILGTKYAVNTLEERNPPAECMLQSKSSRYKITATRLIPIILPKRVK